MNKFAKIIIAVLILIAIIVAIPLYQLWVMFSPIDHTVVHGDQCLNELQGDNYRCWDILVPDDLEDQAVPLVLDLHGYFNDPELQRSQSGFEALAVAEKFIVAWPYGINKSWNAGGEKWPHETDAPGTPGQGCCGYALNNEIDDVSFLLQMITQLQEEHNIDEQRIYLTGFSNGCSMAQRLATERSDLFAGVGCMSMFVLVDAPPDYAPIPIIEVHGTQDSTAAYERNAWQGAVANFEIWKERNGCASVTQEVWREGNHSMIEAQDCTNDANVALITIDESEHVTYKEKNGADIDTTKMVWEFLISNTTP